MATTSCLQGLAALRKVRPQAAGPPRYGGLRTCRDWSQLLTADSASGLYGFARLNPLNRRSKSAVSVTPRQGNKLILRKGGGVVTAGRCAFNFSSAAGRCESASKFCSLYSPFGPAEAVKFGIDFWHFRKYNAE